MPLICSRTPVAVQECAGTFVKKIYLYLVLGRKTTHKNVFVRIFLSSPRRLNNLTTVNDGRSIN
jgi:hypothetical protein